MTNVVGPDDKRRDVKYDKISWFCVKILSTNVTVCGTILISYDSG